MSKHTTTFVVPDLCCSTEEAAIRKKLDTVEGVEIRGINILEQTVNVCHRCPADQILRELHDIGMNARLQNEIVETPSFRKRNGKLMLMIVAAIVLLGGLIHTFINGMEIFSIILFVLSILASGWNILLKGMKAVKNFSLDMNFLMTVATAGAMIIGKWEEGAVVMFLFALAEMLERNSMKRSRNAIHSLLTLAPQTANVAKNESTVSVDVKNVMVGDRIFIKPGEQVPLDGIIVSGTSSLNQAPITGESKPVMKQTGDEVYAGSYNERGALELRVTKQHNDTMLARVVRLVEEAQNSRAPVNTLVDRFTRYYTPIVFGLACLVAFVPPVFLHQEFTVWFYRALVLLVIACPCALVLSTPVTIMSGIANAAKHGVLIKGGKYLEILGTIKAVAFDKTGTLTKGTPHVTDIIPLTSYSEREIITIAALLERHSDHHLAKAVKLRAAGQNHESGNSLVQDFESVTGKGIHATIDGRKFIAGSHYFIEELKLCSPGVERALEELEAEGKTTIILATEHEPIGIIAVADEIRQEAKSSIQSLRSAGIHKTILLTGDNDKTARSIAMQTGIEEVQSHILPHEKVSHIEELKQRYGNVAMVGDGINDAPALASATVGIAMGRTGSDISLETADVVLMADDLEKVSYAMELSKTTLRIIKQNIAIALVTKIIFLVLGLTGNATLWMAIIADDGATLAVILNGLRALRFKSSQ